MRRSLLVLLVLSTAFVSCSAHSDKEIQTSDVRAEQVTSPPNHIGVGQFEEMLAQPDVQIIDVRTPSERSDGYIAGSQLTDFSDFENFKTAVKSLDKTKPVLVYCAAGGRSASASDYLSQEGFLAVYDLKGGLGAWKGAGKPIQK